MDGHGPISRASHTVALPALALALAVVAFLTLRTHRRLRLFPVWQQSFSVLFFILVERLLVFWINGIIGYPPLDAWFLLPLLTGMLRLLCAST